MQFLTLPIELFELVLRDCIIARGLKRGLRLRLVNKTFAKGVMDALYTFRLFDQLLEHYLDPHGPHGPGEIPLSLRGPYLAYRVIQEPSHGNPALANIRRAAHEIHQWDDAGKVQLPTVDDYVKLLCSTMDSFYSPTEIESRSEKDRDTRYSPTARFVRALQGKCPEDLLDVHLEGYTYALYAAAIRTNCLSLIQNCIARYPKLLDTTISCQWEWRNNLILGDCFIIAARYANPEVLTYFLTAGTDKKSRFRHFILSEAAHAGRVDIAFFLCHFKSDEDPLEFFEPEYYYRGSTAWIYGTSDLDTIKFAATLTPEPDPPIKKYVLVYALQEAAAAGRLDTVTYLIQNNVPASGLIVFAERYEFDYILQHNLGNLARMYEWQHYPVRIAAENGHARIVKLLVQHGASASVAMSTAARHGHGHVVQSLLSAYPPSEDALLNAAIGGYTTVARMLLESGANANGGLEDRGTSTEGSMMERKSPLAYAISKENVALCKLLVQHGATFEMPGILDECVKETKGNGLDSMLVLLQKWTNRDQLGRA
ncbi:ankyrin [Karstenula rhodostoma CBS 690.94]|uniref:Ankyrin n=1 Tax=Karstenula rhodostoma CBS 690.94 TaxID=1392251 RepID=A0A9P4PPT3_9PLEO|nr:ankyrin [Karstenula rhodostoma CBS 690.94]